MTEYVLKTKAKEFRERLNIGKFSYSNGWLHRFKKRFGISNRVISGESAGIDQATIDEG